MHSFSYNICIRQEAGSCCIKYSLCSDTYTFAIQNVAAIASGAYSGSYCTLDFLEITHLKAECQGNNQGVNRVCGHAFNVQLGNTISASTLCGMYKHKKGFFHEQQSLLESLNSIITTFFLCRLYCSIHSSIHNKCTCARY